MINGSVPIRGVIFDFHATLVDARSAGSWIRTAWRDLGRPVEPAPLTAGEFDDLAEYLHRIWEHAMVLDPNSERDLSQLRHREVFAQTVGRGPGVDPGLVEALYTVMTDQWLAFDDTEPVLRELKARGIRVVVLSNVGVDIRACLEREGVADLIDGIVLSYEVGVVKPDPEIFAHALTALDLPASEVLMVGDSWLADGGGAALGIRTLILPRTEGPVHGLDAVLRLVGA